MFRIVRSIKLSSLWKKKHAIEEWPHRIFGDVGVSFLSIILQWRRGFSCKNESDNLQSMVALLAHIYDQPTINTLVGLPTRVGNIIHSAWRCHDIPWHWTQFSQQSLQSPLSHNFLCLRHSAHVHFLTSAVFAKTAVVPSCASHASGTAISTVPQVE